jgi:hypothetical protein
VLAFDFDLVLLYCFQWLQNHKKGKQMGLESLHPAAQVAVIVCITVIAILFIWLCVRG